MTATGAVGGEDLEIRSAAGGSELALRVKTKAPEDRLVGLHGTALKLAVREAPERGKANRAICALLSRILRVPASAVRIVAGEASHDKTVRIEGLAPVECRRRLAEHLGRG